MILGMGRTKVKGETALQGTNNDLPPEATTKISQQIFDSPIRHERPFARIQLTVESDSFVLQQYHEPHSDDDSLTAHQVQDPSLVRILHKALAPRSDIDDNETKDQVKDGQLSIGPVQSNSPSSLAEGQQSRVSFITPESYTRSEGAKDYIIYGCIGLLDLHTGPHFIVITSVKYLGDIEDKPVYAIGKVAVLPLEANGALQVLEKTAQWIDPSFGPVTHVREESEQSNNAQDLEIEEEIPEQPVQVAPTKPQKIRFSFLGSKQDKGLQKSTPSPSLLSASSSESNLQSSVVNNTKSPRKISFDTPQPGSVTLPTSKNDINEASESAISSPLSSPPVSPRGFFAKLKDNMLEKSPKKSFVDGSIPPRTSTEIRTSIDQANPPGISRVEPLSSQKQPKASESIPKAKIDRIEISKSRSPSFSAPKSPSVYESAEKFVVQSTKQLTDWSEEAVSGVFKSSKSAASIPVSTTDKLTEGERPQSSNDNLDSADEEEQEKNRLLDRRVIREISSIFGRGFYFSTEFNLLSSKQRRFSKESRLKENDPLWQQVDKRFWWNEHLLREFLEIEAHGYILPVMQGYVEIEQCVIEEQPFEFTLISRRSRERSGLRYQRRGIDEMGNTANFVETEQLLRIVRDDSDHQVSFVQTRGSIPLFWSQSPYRLKPIPIMERTEQENEEGFKKHIDSLIKLYGRQIFINLVEQHGREFIAGSAYTRHIEKLAEPQIKYVDFDFHEQCKGMKYENIERLIKNLESQILELGYCWLTPKHNTRKGEEPFERLFDQKGVIRTNCMDCLDRTNVVQSAIGRHILNHQLLRLGIASFPDKGLSVYEDFENVFNNVWANNGDAISREYAGTSALKGDFTRTGKRNLQGMINDATNSMARMYQNTFKDYFRQAAIDYLLGVTDLHVFKNLQTTPFGTAVVPHPILPEPPTTSQEKHASLLESDPTTNDFAASATLLPPSDSQLSSVSLDDTTDPSQEKALQQEAWIKIREAAIETSAEIVISPGEEVWEGWTFICCSNEISSAFTSESSPENPVLAANKKSSRPPFSKNPNSKSRPQNSSMFYDEKVVLLTDKALYICTYDYEMEKVLEFWRLALEKMTGIDKGAYFLTAQDTSRSGMDPNENYGFAVVYKAKAGGETMRVNSGSVRNRRVMGVNRALQNEVPSLGKVLEEDEESPLSSNGHKDLNESGISITDNEIDAHDDSRSAKGILKEEPKDIRTVRFRIVRHPETLIIPYVRSSEADSRQSNFNVKGTRRTAQDYTESIVAEIVRARCQLISEAEKGASEPRSGLRNRFGRHHSRSPSEEYNYHSPREARRSTVQVDLEIRERVLQSLETVAQLEQDLLKGSKKTDKKSKKAFGGLFTSSKNSTEQSSSITPSTPSNSKSWLKLLQFGQDTDDESDDSDSHPLPKVIIDNTASTNSIDSKSSLTNESRPVETEVKLISNTKRSSSQNMFEKLKLAVKNL